MQYGTVVQWQPRKGFGFIRPDRGQDVFFHISALGACQAAPQIEVGQAVKYELEPGTEPKRRVFKRDLDDTPTPEPVKPRAKIVELIDRIPGATLEEQVSEKSKVQHHPRARRKKPTWRKE
jgi:cold shock CspA family protein